MRADRLLSVLLLLQQHGRLTVGDLAERLEVAPRTVQRDLEALGMAGVPVVATRGRGGGWSLIGGYRTDLSGLNEDEARALFLVAGPGAVAEPAVGQAARSALRKLLHALPDRYRPVVERDRSTVHVDPAGWWQGHRATGTDGAVAAHLATLRAAIDEGRRLWLVYDSGDGRRRRRLADPYGVVQKARTWYLLAGTARGLRTYRVSRIVRLSPAPGGSRRPDDFDLAGAWERGRSAFEARATTMTVLVRGTHRDLARARRALEQYADPEHGTDDAGLLALRFGGARHAAAVLAGWAGMVEVVEPEEVRTALAETGGRLRALYGD